MTNFVHWAGGEGFPYVLIGTSLVALGLVVLAFWYGLQPVSRPSRWRHAGRSARQR